MRYKSLKGVVGVTVILVLFASNASAQLDLTKSCTGTNASLIKGTPASELLGESGTRKAPYGVILGNGVSEHLPRRGNDSQTDTAHYEFIDTNYVNFKWWPSFIGGDLFLSGEIYGLHLSGIGSLTAGAGPGAEVRIRPFFIGGSVGVCGDEGIRYLHPSGTFNFYSLYAGVIFDNYRAEIGEVHGDNSGWGSHTPRLDYTSGFVGVSKRWGEIFFVEPGIRIMLPIVSHYYLMPRFLEFVPTTGHYGLADLYVSFDVKVGIGFN